MPERLPPAIFLAACGLPLLASCGGEPRTSDEIFRDRLALPAVYLTVDTDTRVIAPQSKGPFVDEATGELALPALACHNPDCPARGADGEPHVFIEKRTAFFVEPDGSVGYDESRIGTEITGLCPKCVSGKDLKRLKRDKLQQYVNWSRPYVLPETEARMKELDAELKEIGEADGS